MNTSLKQCFHAVQNYEINLTKCLILFCICHRIAFKADMPISSNAIKTNITISAFSEPAPKCHQTVFVCFICQSMDSFWSKKRSQVWLHEIMALIFIHLSISEGIQMFLNVFVCIWPCFLAAVDHLMLPSRFDRFIATRPSSQCFHGNHIPFWTTDISFSSCAVRLITAHTFRQL